MAQKRSKVSSVPTPVFSTLSEQHWDMICDALVFFVREQGARLKEENARDEDWTRLQEYDNLLTDLLFYVIPPRNKYKEDKGDNVTRDEVHRPE